MSESDSQDGEDESSDEIVLDASEMDDSETIQCPGCGLEGEVPGFFIGKIVECKDEDCERQFVARPAEEVEG